MRFIDETEICNKTKTAQQTIYSSSVTSFILIIQNFVYTSYRKMDDAELAQLPEITLEELSQFRSDPIYMAVDGRIFDVTSGKGFYGPEGA